MGFFSKVWKGIKKGVKKIGKGIKKVASKVVKGVKKFAKSKLGKAILIGAALTVGYMYFTNTGLFGAEGMFSGSGFGAGAEASTAVAQSTAPTTTSVGSSMAGEAAAGETIAGSGGLDFAATGINTTAPAAPGLAPVVQSTPAWSQTAANIAKDTAAINSQTAGQLVAKGLGTAGATAWDGVKAAGSFMQENPYATMAIGQGIQAMNTPSDAENQIAIEKWRRDNSNIAGVNYDGSGSPLGMGLVSRANTDAVQQGYTGNRRTNRWTG